MRAGKNVRPAAVFLLERGVLGAQLLVLRAQTLLLRLVRRQWLGGLRLGLGHGHGARGRDKVCSRYNLVISLSHDPTCHGRALQENAVRRL